MSSQNQRLSQFNLPYFTRIIFNWQYWRDSFDTTIHNLQFGGCTDMTFIYWKSLPESDATNVINWLTFSGSKYHKSIELITNRIGQKYEIVNAYMQALLKFPTLTLLNWNTNVVSSYYSWKNIQWIFVCSSFSGIGTQIDSISSFCYISFLLF